MADPTMREVLAELTALRAEVAAQRQARRRWRASRRLLPILLVALLVALTPLALLAANPFTDLNSGSVHNANIDAIYNAGITTGCVPDQQYCPNDLVTREQMASFLARTAGLGGNPPVAHALTAQTATDATTIGGLAPSGLVRVARAVGINRFDVPTPSLFDVTGVYNASDPNTSTYNDLLVLTITTPADGFVLINGTVGMTSLQAGTLGLARLRDNANGLVSPVEISAAMGNGSGGTTTLTYVFPVAPGQHEFTLQVTRFPSGSSVKALDAVLTALFVPFGSTGGSTLAAP